MKEKANKGNGKKCAGFCSVRIRSASKERAVALLLASNKKKTGRKIKFDELFELAIGLVTDEHIKLLQERSLTNEDRFEELRQKYIETRGPVSKEQWLGFAMTAEFPLFLMEQTGRKDAA